VIDRGVAVLGALLAVTLTAAAVSAAQQGVAPTYPSVPCHVTRIVDGDTFDIDCDVWPELEIHDRLRLLGVDAPELRAPAQNNLPSGQQVKADVADYLGPLPAAVMVTAHKNDSFGRVLADVQDPENGSLAGWLLATGRAVPYP
jgi:endonuclease YncB( thermonuclease family)